MKRLVYILLIAIVAVACKPTAENYRAAYDRAIASRDSAANAVDGTVYAQVRNQMAINQATIDGETVDVATQFVIPTDDGGGIPESLKRYCVVVGRFKQNFNARSMRERLVDSGYPGAFVVQTREPYFFIVAGSFESPGEALALMKRYAADPAVPHTSEPFILQPSQLSRRLK